jgi:hypothetical protein
MSEKAKASRQPALCSGRLSGRCPVNKIAMFPLETFI